METEAENFNVYLTPHLEKFQTSDSETADIMHATWNFGNALKSKGFDLIYMCGPVGMFEGNLLITEKLEVKDIEQFITDNPKENVYFLYQRLPNVLRFTALPKDYLEEQRQTRKNSLTSNNESDKVTSLKGEPL